MNLVLLIEQVLLAGTVIISALMLRNSFSKNVIGSLFRVGSFLGASWLALVLFQGARAAGCTFLASAVLGLGIAGILFHLLVLRLRSKVKENHWEGRLSEWMRLPRWLDIACSGGLVLLLWVGFLISAAVVSEIVSLNPAGYAMSRDALFLKYLMDGESNGESLVDETSTEALDDESLAKKRRAIRQAAREQAEYFNRFFRGIKQTKKQFYQATGLDEVKHEIDLARRVIHLPEDQKIWLLTHHPPLMELVDHPVMVRILDNRPLMERFDRFAGGRLDEVWQIGAHPDVQQLMEDPEVKHLIQNIDLDELLRQCEREGFESELHP